MPVRYVEVNPISQLFVAATRAFGDIAIVGRCDQAATASVQVPQAFTNPADAAAPFAGDVADAIAIAFRQTPGPTTVWGVRVDANSPDWAAALTEVMKLDVQIVALAATPLNNANTAAVTALVDHVKASEKGEDGKERIGVAALEAGATDLTAVTSSTFKQERMVYIAHKADKRTAQARAADDAAPAVAGVIAGYEPHISILLKPIDIAMSGTFTDTQIDAFDKAGINWVTDPVLFRGRSFFMGEGYSGNRDGTKPYVDIIRALDAISFALKATLIQTIGTLRISRSGLRAIITLVQSVLSPLQAREVIEGYAIHIPLLVLLDKDPDSLSDAELKQIDAAQAARRVDMAVTVDYAGAIHRLRIDLVFR